MNESHLRLWLKSELKVNCVTVNNMIERALKAIINGEHQITTTPEHLLALSRATQILIILQEKFAKNE